MLNQGSETDIFNPHPDYSAQALSKETLPVSCTPSLQPQPGLLPSPGIISVAPRCYRNAEGKAAEECEPKSLPVAEISGGISEVSFSWQHPNGWLGEHLSPGVELPQLRESRAIELNLLRFFFSFFFRKRNLLVQCFLLRILSCQTHFPSVAHQHPDGCLQDAHGVSTLLPMPCASVLRGCCYSYSFIAHGHSNNVQKCC